MSKVVAIIQARMGSTRLQGKVMMDLCKKTVLEHVILRVKQSKLIDEIVIATTTKQDDDTIVKEAEKLGVKYFRGSEDDVLSRYYYAAKENSADVIVRITSDCPLIDPKVIDEIIGFYKEQDYDIVSNAGSDLIQRTYPRGLDTEVFSFKQLKDTFNNASDKYQREHVTPYIYENSVRVYYYKNKHNFSIHRWTLDTPEDLKLITEVYYNFYTGEHDFYLEDILELFKEQPNLLEINREIEQKKIK